MRMTQEFLEYSALDSACTVEIHDAFWENIDPVFSAANDLTMKLLPVLMFMQTRGIKVNQHALSDTKVDVLQAAKEKQLELNSLCGHELNVNSPKACQDYFYNQLGIPPYRNAEDPLPPPPTLVEQTLFSSGHCPSLPLGDAQGHPLARALS